ncbi:MAG: hypothetical protein NVS1B4_13040 [Gemmatimonadaceae bacterium]
MPTRTVVGLNGAWAVSLSGRVTANEHDEFALVFVRRDGRIGETRIARYSPVQTRSRAQSFAELSDADLQRLLESAQPTSTSPEASYRS